MSLINKALSELNESQHKNPDANRQSHMHGTPILAAKKKKQNITVLIAVFLALLITSTTMTIILIKKHQQKTKIRVSSHNNKITQTNAKKTSLRSQPLTLSAKKHGATPPISIPEASPTSTTPRQTTQQNKPVISSARNTTQLTRKITIAEADHITPATQNTGANNHGNNIKVTPSKNKVTDVSDKSITTKKWNLAKTPDQLSAKIIAINTKQQRATPHSLNTTTADKKALAQNTDKKQISTTGNIIDKNAMAKHQKISQNLDNQNTAAVESQTNNGGNNIVQVSSNSADNIEKSTDQHSIQIYNNIMGKIANNPSININTQLNNPSLQQELTTHQMANIAQQLISNGEIGQANEFLSMEVEAHSDSVRLSQLYAKTLYLKNQFVQALAVLSNLAPTFYDHTDYYNLMANIYMKLNQIAIANQIYQHLVQVQPNSFQYWLGLAIANQRLNNKDIAISGYQHTLSLTPIDSNVARFSRQQLYLLQKKI